MTSHTLVEAAFGEYPKRSSQVLFPVQPLFFQALELGICPNFQCTPIFRPAQTAMFLIRGAFVLQRARLECSFAVRT